MKLLLCVFVLFGCVFPCLAQTPLFDQSVTYRFASAEAKILWPQNGFSEFQQQAQSIAQYDIADEDQERAIYLPLLATQLTRNPIFSISASGGVVDFFSQEKNQYKAPQLIFAVNGSKRLIIADIDTYIAKKDRKPSSSKKIVKAGGGHTILLNFTIPNDIELKDITEPQLMLTTTNRQYGKSTVQLSLLPSPADTLEVEQGLAQQYPMDNGIEAHPKVYFADNFDQQSWLGSMKTAIGLTEPVWQNTGELQYVDHASVRHFSGQPGQAVKMPFRTSSNLAGNLDYYFAQHNGNEPDQAYFRYYSMLAPGAYVSGGGKLPGFGGTYNQAGWGGRANNGKNGWSARGAFYQSIKSSNPNWPNQLPLGSYIYEVDTKNKYGKSIPWGHPLSAMQPGKWYAIEQFLKLNSPGQNDGVLTVWIDGKQIYHRDNLHFRDSDKLKIEKIWLNYYFGGVAKPDKPFDMYLDNIVIASQYIGPSQY